jgi:hypothetical protein
VCILFSFYARGLCALLFKKNIKKYKNAPSLCSTQALLGTPIIHESNPNSWSVPNRPLHSVLNVLQLSL